MNKGLQLRCFRSNKFNTLDDISLQACESNIQKLLLVVINAWDYVVGLESTVGAEFHGDGKIVKPTNGLAYFLTTTDSGKVDVSGFDETLLTLGCVKKG